MAALRDLGSGCCSVFCLDLNGGIIWASTEIRDWNGLMPSCAHLYNAYRDRKSKDPDERMKVPQAFTFLRREGRVIA